MLITVKKIKALNPCFDRFNNFCNHYPNYSNTIQDFITLKNITYNDKVWVITRLFTKDQNVKWSLLCASSVLHIFEEQFPNDKRPRQALEAVEAYLNNPCDETIAAARSAAWSAWSAWSAARSAAWSAWSAAESAAESAARSAAWSAWSAARLAALSARSAAESEKNQEEINLLFMLECI